MLDLIGTIALVGVIAFNISAFNNAMPVSAAARLTIAAVARAWTGLAAAVAAAGCSRTRVYSFPGLGPSWHPRW